MSDMKLFIEQRLVYKHSPKLKSQSSVLPDDHLRLKLVGFDRTVFAFHHCPQNGFKIRVAIKILENDPGY